MRRPLAAALAAALPALACSSSSSGPSSFTFGIDFLSVSAAVQVDTLEISLFDVNATGTDCQTLYFARVSGAPLPPTAVPVENLSTCDVAVAQKGAVTVPYGTYAILVVAKQGGTNPYYAGCAEEKATAADDPANPPIVELTRVNASVPLPPATACTTVADHCQGKC